MIIVEEDKESLEQKILDIEKRLDELEGQIKQLKEILNVEKGIEEPITSMSTKKEKKFLKYINWDRK